MAKSSNRFQAPQEECSWLSGGSGFTGHPTALGKGAHRPAGLTGQPAVRDSGLTDCQEATSSATAFIHTPPSPQLQTLGFQRAQERGPW